MFLLTKIFLAILASASAFRAAVRIRPRVSAVQAGDDVAAGLGGKVVVTGIGEVDDDEFMLTLLNEQVCQFIMYGIFSCS